MDKEEFCDKYCPVPVRFTNNEDKKDVWADCDLNEEVCPFKCVDFSNVEKSNFNG